MKKLTLKILDIHCPACIMRLESLEDKLEGVSSATASYKSQLMEIKFDEAVLNEEQIVEAVRELGYTPEMA